MAEGDDSGAFVLPTDFSQLLELPETAFADSNDVLACSTGAAELMQPTCSVHPDTTEYVWCSGSDQMFC